MAGSSVDFKANANGLVIVFDRNETFDSICEQISRKLESGGLFFQTRYLAMTYRGRKLSAEEEGAISRLMAEKTGAKTVLFEYDKDFERAAHASVAASPAGGISPAGGGDRGAGASAGSRAADGDSDAEGERNRAELRARDVATALRRRFAARDLDECMTKFHRGTLRSGKLISYDGNVVIIGDVNPGAEVEATGNIIVIGTVKGIVHAGAGGNKETSVIALNFAPTQLRIADIITHRDARKTGPASARTPEIAYLVGDSIVFDKL